MYIDTIKIPNLSPTVVFLFQSLMDTILSVTNVFSTSFVFICLLNIVIHRQEKVKLIRLYDLVASLVLIKRKR